MFWEIFVKLCADNGEKPTPLVTKLGFSKGNVSYWKNGHLPQAVALHKIADYFGVTVEYLLGKEEPQKEKAPTEEALKVALFGGADVPDELWDKVTQYARFLVEEDMRNRK